VPVEERKVPVGPGIPDVTVYVINAGKRPGGGPRPAILHTHGGGFVAGTAKAERGYLQDFAHALDCVIVTVEYTLAPEARYTRSLDETYARLRWLHEQAEALGVDRARLAVMGESAGGGHAALLAIRARDRGEVPLVLQALTYPMLDDRTGSTVTPPPGVGRLGWDAQANRFGWASFLGAEPGSRQVPAAGVPARCARLGRPGARIHRGGRDRPVRGRGHHLCAAADRCRGADRTAGGARRLSRV
jgi:acetyl esterase/lipase